MFYRDFLTEVHRRLAPRAYLEIGVRRGDSLALATCRAVGVDPAFRIVVELDGDIALFRTTSDEYFSRPDPLAATGGVPFSLSFVDGLHLFEFALRDFMAAERCSAPNGLIVFDDVLPRTVEEAARERQVVLWTGDVFRVWQVLSRYRPDLIVIPLDTAPTGLLAVAGLDPQNTVLRDNYADILAEFRYADPQPVPADILDRLSMVPPRRFLEAGILELLAQLPADRPAAAVASPLRQRVAARLGAGFVSDPAGRGAG